MLSLASWFPQAEGLDVGQKRRGEHDCGPGSGLLLSRDARGYHAWCFRCSSAGFKGPPAESLADKLARVAAMQAGERAVQLAALSGCLPTPQVRDVSQWPERAALWLYKAGLGRAEIGALGAYYHPPSDRVVLPVLDPATGLPCFFQARAYQPGRLPKYLGPTPKPPNLLARWGTAAVPTLTEDMLSAIKIGLVAEGWAIMGTRVSDHLVSELMLRGSCNVWLDPDAAGRRGAAKILKQLRAYGIRCRDIVSGRDPKLYNRHEILEFLNDSRDQADGPSADHGVA